MREEQDGEEKGLFPTSRQTWMFLVTDIIIDSSRAEMLNCGS